MPSFRSSVLPRLATACLLALLLAGCDQASQPLERSTPTPGSSPTAPVGSTTSASTPVPAVAARKVDIPVSRPGDRVIVHYHRRDNHYDGAGIWTWDVNGQHTPAQNELPSTGRDDFGLVFQLDRVNYGDSDRVGLVTRLGHDWSHKDGGDKTWTPALGHEVWLLGGKEMVFTQRPDLSPKLESASLDGPVNVTLLLTDPVTATARVTVLDQQNVAQPLESAVASGPASTALAIILKTPLDPVKGRYRVQVEGFGPAVPLVPRGILDDRDLFFDGAAQLGAAYNPQGTTFRLFAPTATAVSVVCYDEATGSRGRTVHPLAPQPKGLWDLTVPGAWQGKFYTYLLDGPGQDPAREVLDPYATNAVASSTRGRITAATPPLRPGARATSPTDMVIYEMHVRDFTVAASSGVQNRGRYLGFTETNTHLPGDAAIRTALDHLTELGVTHVELLPTQDYANDEARPSYNWGYITSAFFSPEGAYATNPNDDSRVHEFKALVNALHARGIGVIMDVVYNHTATDASLTATVPGYYYRHLPDDTLANGSGCGNEVRTEAPMARKLVLDSLAYWAQEYGIDGYRFDLMALLDQETMRQAEQELRAINPGIVLYGEPWTGGSSPLREPCDKTAIRQLPEGAFNDDFRNALKGSPDGHDPGFIQNGANREALKTAMLGSPWFASPGQSINYLTCHDNLVLWDKLKISMPGASDAALVDTMKLGYLALFTSPGVPFLHGGEEFARSKGGNNNSYDAPDAVNQVDWSLKRKHFDLFTYTRDAIALRKAHPVFRLRTREEVAARLKFENTPGSKTLAYTFDGSGLPGETWRHVYVLLNSDDAASAEVTLPPGQWEFAMDGHGAASARSVSGKVSVPQKSGLVLYQR